MTLTIVNGTALLPDAGLVQHDLAIRHGIIEEAFAPGRTLDASGLLVLPGIVDLHGDAFERQIQPRPGVSFPTDLALADTELQLLGNGITTAFHGVTLSWEPGLRGAEAWAQWLAALAARRSRMQCDMRVHMRWEAFNLDALGLALDGIGSGQVHLLAFNDHTPAIVRRMQDPVAAAKYSERAGLPLAAFQSLTQRVAARAGEVADARERIAAAARQAGLPMASHDDDSPATRDAFRALGARLCEFPMSELVAQQAVAAGDWVAMGSPNVVRGGSHLGWASAARMAEAGLCGVLTSDYFYPALLQAPFMLAARGVLGFAAAWALVSANPAQAAGLHDRGVLAPGRRADIILVAPEPAPRVVATVTAGQVAFLSGEGAARLR